MRKKHKMANICRSLQKKTKIYPVLKSPTHIGFICVKKWVENLTLGHLQAIYTDTLSCGDIGFKTNFRSSFGLEIRLRSAFTAFRALLPSANYSAEWSGRVWQPFAYSIGSFGPLFFYLKGAKPIIVSSGLSHPTQELNLKKVRQTAITICRRLSHLTEFWMGSIAFWEHITAFFKDRKTL